MPTLARNNFELPVTRAQLYEAQQYQAALQQLSGAVLMAHQARQAYPALPEL